MEMLTSWSSRWKKNLPLLSRVWSARKINLKRRNPTGTKITSCPLEGTKWSDQQSRERNSSVRMSTWTVKTLLSRTVTISQRTVSLCRHLPDN